MPLAQLLNQPIEVIEKLGLNLHVLTQLASKNINKKL
jgi:hypothetical protein